ncbi:MAG: sensor domain-containing diguanylate cyclase [Candidatus Sericytochromatia bacterium]|nr:sensor domain-containing diguanylate cyclase [Candidatus Sericytochromatia bacterium]
MDSLERVVEVAPSLPEAEQQSLEHLLYVLSALGEMAEQMTTNPNPQSSIRAIVRMACGALGIRRAALFLYAPEEGELYSVVGSDEETVRLVVTSDVRRFLWSEGGNLIDRENPHPLLIEFMTGNSELLCDLPEATWLPLSVTRHFLGLLMLGDKLSRAPLSQTERDILILIGRQLAVALHNNQLKTNLMAANKQLGLKVWQLEQLYDVSRGISSSLERDRVATELMQRAVELLGARKGLLLLKDDSGEWCEVLASFGFSLENAVPRDSVNHPWLLASLESEAPRAFVQSELPHDFDATWALSAPIVYQERLLGVLVVFDKEAAEGLEPFSSEEDVPMLANIASLAATAIENARLYELATVDGLTRLFIRRHFEQRLSEELRRSERYGTQASLLIMDIDHFKRFNDTHGHQTGDEVLRWVARTIRHSIRDVDVPGRFGGEELLVLMPETETDGAYIMAERVREAIGAMELPGPAGEPLGVTVSVGVATFPDHGRDATALVESADRALYRSKALGRNRVTLAE